MQKITVDNLNKAFGAFINRCDGQVEQFLTSPGYQDFCRAEACTIAQSVEGVDPPSAQELFNFLDSIFRNSFYYANHIEEEVPNVHEALVFQRVEEFLQQDAQTIINRLFASMKIDDFYVLNKLGYDFQIKNLPAILLDAVKLRSSAKEKFKQSDWFALIRACTTECDDLSSINFAPLRNILIAVNSFSISSDWAGNTAEYNAALQLKVRKELLELLINMGADPSKPYCNSSDDSVIEFYMTDQPKLFKHILDKFPQYCDHQQILESASRFLYRSIFPSENHSTFKFFEPNSYYDNLKESFMYMRQLGIDLNDPNTVSPGLLLSSYASGDTSSLAEQFQIPSSYIDTRQKRMTLQSNLDQAIADLL